MTAKISRVRFFYTDHRYLNFLLFALFFLLGMVKFQLFQDNFDTGYSKSKNVEEARLNPKNLSVYGTKGLFERNEEDISSDAYETAEDSDSVFEDASDGALRSRRAFKSSGVAGASSFGAEVSL